MVTNLKFLMYQKKKLKIASSYDLIGRLFMLVLARQTEEKIIIGEGEDAVTLQVLGMDKKYVRLGFEAKPHIKIDR